MPQSLNLGVNTKDFTEYTDYNYTSNDNKKFDKVNRFGAFSMERCTSQASTLSFSRDICRICHCEGDEDSPLITPCFCAGSLRYVHQSCLQQWIKSSDTKSCELCKFVFIMQSKVKPINKWERLDLSEMERRKIVCSVAFHIIAITCVVWSLFVLIQRTFREEGTLEWPFWTKIVVVAIGIIGSVVFMYVQCKMYFELCRRWRAFNRVIYVQDVPEKAPLKDHEKGLLKPLDGNLAKGASLSNIVIEKSAGRLSVISDVLNLRSCNFHPESINSAAAVCGSTRSLSSLAWGEDAPADKYSPSVNARSSELETLIPSTEPWLPQDPIKTITPGVHLSTRSSNEHQICVESPAAGAKPTEVDDSDVEVVHLESK